MKEILGILVLVLSLFIFSVALPSIMILRGKLDNLQNKVVTSGCAKWIPDSEDPTIQTLKFTHETSNR